MFATDIANVRYDTTIMKNMQPASMISQQYAHCLTAKLCKAGDVYIEDTQNDVFMDEIYKLIRYSLQNNRVTNPQTNWTEPRLSSGASLGYSKEIRIASSGQQSAEHLALVVPQEVLEQTQYHKQR